MIQNAENKNTYPSDTIDDTALEHEQYDKDKQTVSQAYRN